MKVHFFNANSFYGTVDYIDFYFHSNLVDFIPFFDAISLYLFWKFILK